MKSIIKAVARLRLATGIVVLFLFSPLKGQDYLLEAFVAGLPDQMVYLSLIKGDSHLKKDSIVSVNGNIQFKIPSNSQTGMYRLFLGDERMASFFDREIMYFDVVFNKENIRLQTSYNNPAGDMLVLESAENELFYRFLRAREEFYSRFGLLMQTGRYYGPNDTFYNHWRDEILRVQKAVTDSIVRITGLLPESFISSYASMYIEPVYDPESGVSYEEYMKVHYFDLIAMKDPELIYSQVFNQKVVTYLGFYRQANADQSEQEDQFILAIDHLMQHCDYNQQVYDFVLNYLLEGFERFKMEKVLVHIAGNHLTGECETDNRKIMEQRLEAYKSMAPGKKVNDFVLPDLNNEAHRLSELKSDYVLLVFWASWCPHCTQLMPRLNKWYIENGKSHDLEIFAVSIDTSRFDWEEFSLLNRLSYINTYEQSGWEGKVARQYNLYATPTMFLLDRERKILSKPLTFREFIQAIGKL